MNFSSDIINMTLPVFLEYAMGCTYRELKELSKILEEYHPQGLEQYVTIEVQLAQEKLSVVWKLLKKYERVLNTPVRSITQEF